MLPEASELITLVSITPVVDMAGAFHMSSYDATRGGLVTLHCDHHGFAGVCWS